MTVKKDSRGRVRDYAKEYARDQSSPSAIHNRSLRNSARAEAKKKYGASAIAGKDVSHNTPLATASNPDAVGWKMQSAHINRGKDNKKIHNRSK